MKVKESQTPAGPVSCADLADALGADPVFALVLALTLALILLVLTLTLILLALALIDGYQKK